MMMMIMLTFCTTITSNLRKAHVTRDSSGPATWAIVSYPVSVTFERTHFTLRLRRWMSSLNLLSNETNDA